MKETIHGILTGYFLSYALSDTATYSRVQTKLYEGD